MNLAIQPHNDSVTKAINNYYAKFFFIFSRAGDNSSIS